MAIAMCLFCEKLVTTGSALIVLKGNLLSDGKFEARDQAGYLHERCAERGSSGIDLESFPITFAPIR